MADRPKFDNAPGLALKPRKGGWEARWQARTDLVERGYEPKSARLCVIGDEPTDAERSFVSDRCNVLQSAMLTWGRGGVPLVGSYNGSVRSLVAKYQTDVDSPYHKLRHQTKLNYANMCRRIEDTVWLDDDKQPHVLGDDLIAGLTARTMLRLHRLWSNDGEKIAMGHSLIGMFRTLLSFGMTILDDDACAKLGLILHKMRFPMSRPRDEQLTAEQADAIRAHCHKIKLPSLALAQAFQFEGTLRQKDVIGEWVPIAEPGVSDVIDGREKWIRGIRWEEIDANLILTHVTSKRQKEIVIDLKLAPMVVDELQRAYPGCIVGTLVNRALLPASGPIVVFEKISLPYTAVNYRRRWREAARAVGVPDEVFNMDTRAGAISEATDAGADLEHVRHAATHSNVSMTQRYSRSGPNKVAGVMKQRVEHRTKAKLPR